MTLTTNTTGNMTKYAVRLWNLLSLERRTYKCSCSQGQLRQYMFSFTHKNNIG